MLGAKRKQVRKACINCRKGHRCCEDERPCKRCVRTGKTCEEDEEMRLEIHMYPKVSRHAPIIWQDHSAQPASIQSERKPPTTTAFTSNGFKPEASEPLPAAAMRFPRFPDRNRLSPVDIPTQDLSHALLLSKSASIQSGEPASQTERLAPISVDRIDNPDSQLPQSLRNLRESFLSGHAFSESRSSSSLDSVAEHLKDSLGRDVPPPASVSSAASHPTSSKAARERTPSPAAAQPSLMTRDVPPPVLPPSLTLSTSSSTFPRSDASLHLNRQLPLPVQFSSATTVSAASRQPTTLAHLLNNAHTAN